MSITEYFLEWKPGEFSLLYFDSSAIEVLWAVVLKFAEFLRYTNDLFGLWATGDGKLFFFWNVSISSVINTRLPLHISDFPLRFIHYYETSYLASGMNPIDLN